MRQSEEWQSDLPGEVRSGSERSQSSNECTHFSVPPISRVKKKISPKPLGSSLSKHRHLNHKTIIIERIVQNPMNGSLNTLILCECLGSK